MGSDLRDISWDSYISEESSIVISTQKAASHLTAVKKSSESAIVAATAGGASSLEPKKSMDLGEKSWCLDESMTKKPEIPKTEPDNKVQPSHSAVRATQTNRTQDNDNVRDVSWDVDVSLPVEAVVPVLDTATVTLSSFKESDSQSISSKLNEERTISLGSKPTMDTREPSQLCHQHSLRTATGDPSLSPSSSRFCAQDVRFESSGRAALLQPATMNAVSSTFSNTLPEKQSNTATMQREIPGNVQRVIGVAGVEGKLSLLNQYAEKYSARAIIHTGNFGFYNDDSCHSLSFDALKTAIKRRISSADLSTVHEEEIRKMASKKHLLSELPDFIEGVKRFNIPVYVIWGQYEDTSVIEKIRKGVYHIPNLYILDHRNSYAISTGHVTLRLFGLGGLFNYHKLFDCGSQQSSEIVSGSDGLVWSNFIQMGELVEMADKYTGTDEIRVLITQDSPSKEPLAHFIATEIKADFTLSHNLESSMCSIYDDKTIHNTLSLNTFLAPAKEDVHSLWDQVYFACSDKFTDIQRKSGSRFANALKQTLPALEARHNITHISLSSIQNGKVKFCLAENGISIETISNFIPSTCYAPLLENNETLTATEASKVDKREHFESSKTKNNNVKHAQSAPIEPKFSDMAPLPSSSHPIASNLTNKEEKTPFFEDRLGATEKARPREPKMIIDNLPWDISGKELDEAVFALYEVICFV